MTFQLNAGRPFSLAGVGRVDEKGADLLYLLCLQGLLLTPYQVDKADASMLNTKVA